MERDRDRDRARARAHTNTHTHTHTHRVMPEAQESPVKTWNMVNKDVVKDSKFPSGSRSESPPKMCVKRVAKIAVLECQEGGNRGLDVAGKGGGGGVGGVKEGREGGSGL